MQLKKPRRAAGSRASLAVATLGLLGVAAAHAQDLPSNPIDDLPLPIEAQKTWEFDTGVLVYAEGGGRVQAAEPVVKATRSFENGATTTVKFVLDSLTGASPNGATPASTPQTFSGPSGGGHSYTTPAYETPLDDSFKDTRVALSGDLLLPVSQNGKVGLGLNVSSEFDFFSAGGNLRYSLDLNQHNTTLSAGLAYEADTIEPVGGTPTALAVLPPASEQETEEEDDGGGGALGVATQSKNVADLVLGLTQVLDPRTVLQLNYSLSSSDGYHTDPYKLLSVVDASGEPLRYVFEGRPDSRTKHALFARIKRYVFGRDVLDASYRYMTDDWGVQSSTVDSLFRWNFAAHDYVEPHVRWYTQTAADFYHAALYDGEETTVAYATADPRLGAFDGLTVGLKYGHTLSSGSQWDARLEYYQQDGKREGVPAQAAAGLEKFKLEPDLSAVMFTVGYRFRW